MTKTTLITGGNRGLGLAVAKRLNGKCRLLLTGRDLNGLKEAAYSNELKNVDFLEIDFGQPMSEENRSVLAKTTVHGMVHCASSFGDTLKQTEQLEFFTWGNFIANSMLLTQLILGNDIDSLRRFVYVGSIVARLRSTIEYTPYRIYKGSLLYLSHSVNAEYNQNHVKSTYLSLGSFKPDGMVDDEHSALKTSTVVDHIIKIILDESNAMVDYIELFPPAER